MTKLAEAFRTIGDLDAARPHGFAEALAKIDAEQGYPARERGKFLMAGFLAEHGPTLDLMHRQHQAGVKAFRASQEAPGANEGRETPINTTDAPEAL